MLRRTQIVALLLLLTTASLLTACGEDTETVVVASKPITEQFILAEMLTANGVDVDAFIGEIANDMLQTRNEHVEDPQVDDETFLEQITERLTQLLNHKRDVQI